MEPTNNTPEITPSSGNGDNLRSLKPQEELSHPIEALPAKSQASASTSEGSGSKESSDALCSKESSELTTQNGTASEKALSKSSESKAEVSRMTAAKLNPQMLRNQEMSAKSKSHANYLNDNNSYWFLLRDLRRANSLEHGYELLEKNGMRVFTPLEWKIKKTPSKKVRVLVPVMPDLLFVFGTYKEVSQQVAIIPRIQFRYLKGKGFMEPTVIPTEEMEYFIKAVSNSDEPKFYLPGEITEEDIGRKVMIIGGPLNGYTGRLLKWKGSKKKALIIEIKNYLVGTVTLEPELIQYVD